MRASDSANLATFPVGRESEYAAYDGANIWVSSFLGSTVMKPRASDGALLGTYMWVANGLASRVTKLQVSGGTMVGV